MLTCLSACFSVNYVFLLRLTWTYFLRDDFVFSRSVGFIRIEKGIRYTVTHKLTCTSVTERSKYVR